MTSTTACKTRKYPKIMSPQDGAAYLRTSRSSLSRWAHEGRNPALIKLGGKYCVSADKLAEQVYPYPDQVMDSKDGYGYVNLPVLHTVSEVAEAIHVTDLVIYSAIREGHVYAVQIGKRYLIPDHQFENLHEYVGYTQLAPYRRCSHDLRNLHTGSHGRGARCIRGN